MDFTDLILIIGTNPLPNYVAAKYFIDENNNLSRIWMICSEKNLNINQESTKKYAVRLKNIIESDHNKIEFGEIRYIEDINKKSAIEEEANKLAKQLSEKGSKKAHLFYTGGTKSVVVHTYNFLRNCTDISFSFSYLSARDFRIHFDNDDSFSYDLREKVKICFKNLVNLHDLELKSVEKENNFENVIYKFEEIIKNSEIDKFYDKKTGYNRDIFKFSNKHMEKIFNDIQKEDSTLIHSTEDEKYFQEQLNGFDINKEIEKNRKENFEERVEILREIINYNPNNIFYKVLDSFPTEYKVFLVKKFNRKIKRHNYNEVIKFLDGLWLEHYIEKIISDPIIEKDELLTNQEPYKGSLINKFELDLVLMRGYQLIGISCTTDKKKNICKSKGFEIILRTRQIGGTEAKAVLITAADENIVEILQNELILDTGTSKENILVVGINDWKKDNMFKKIKNFI